MTIEQEAPPIAQPVRAQDVFAGASRAARYVESPAERPDTVGQIVPAARVEAPAAASAAVAAGISTEPATDLGVLGIRPETHRAQIGVRGVLARLGFKVTPGPVEAARLEAAEQVRRDEEVIRQTTWTRAVSILVANPKGGVGKTPSALAIAGVLASIRGGSVCVVEVSDDPGALTFRAEGNPKLGLGELVRDVEAIRSAGQLAGYTAPQTSFASVIGSTGRRPRLSAENVVDVSRVIDDYYSMRIMDSGNQPSSSAFAGAIATADVLVVPVYNTGDAVLEAINLLEEVRAAGPRGAGLASNAVVLRLTDGRPENDAVSERVDQLIEHAGFAQQFSIPYDAHIAERSQITLARLAQATRRSFTAAAAGIVRTLQETVR